MSDYTLLDLSHSFAEKEHGAGWGEALGGAQPLFNPGNPVTLTHVVLSSVVVLLIVVLATVAAGKYKDRESRLIPEGSFSIRNFFEVIFDGIFNMMASMMKEEQAKKYFPLIAALGVYILISNLMGLVPGLVPPTQNMNTNVAMSLVVFVFYNFVGVREQGIVNYIKHFMGPMLLVAPLIFAIEVFGHAFRPVSLAVRLAGNMTGDHAVLGVFGTIAENIFGGLPLILPIPFLFLGLLVSVVQMVVFCLLSSIYIALAVEVHDDHH